MRAIMALGLAWSVLVCATPSLADRYGADPHPAAQQDPVTNDSIAAARVAPASDIRVACRPVQNAASFDRANFDEARDAKTGSVMSARYDEAPSEPISSGLCH